MFKHLLVPTDGSQLSQDAVTRAVSFAREAGARITFFYAEPEAPTAYLHGLAWQARRHGPAAGQRELQGF